MSLKPLVRWATFQQWTLRYTSRSSDSAEGIFITPAGDVPFRYDRNVRLVHLPERVVHLNEHGWEVDEAGQTRFQFKSSKKDHDDKT